VIGANDSTKTLTVMFGGALSGNYDVSIRHANFGLLKTTGLILNVGATVTSISPLTGSIYGGTTLTITGTNFGSLTTDNPIQISYNGGVGSTDCFVKSSTPTLIKCMIDPTVSFTNGK
jgi:IPT/TIG domain